MISVRKKTSRARQLRKNFTDAEQILWRTVRSRQLGGHKFRRQQPVGRYMVDFVCLEASLVIEVDGGQHAEIRQAAYDDERTAWLRQQGFQVLRFWDHEVLRQLEGVKKAISKALRCARFSLVKSLSSPSTGENRGEGERIIPLILTFSRKGEGTRSVIIDRSWI